MMLRRIAVVILTVGLMMLITACNNAQKKVEQQEDTSRIESTEETTEAATDSNGQDEATEEKTLPTEGVVWEQIDDNQWMAEIPDEDGNTIKVVIGAENIGGDFSDEAKDQSSNADGTQTQPIETKPVETTPSETVTPTVPSVSGSVGPDLSTTYEEYDAMSAAEQLVFYYSFADADAFYQWFNQAKADYEAGRGDIVVGDGNINMDEIFKESN